MIKVTLKGDTVMEFESGITVAEIAKSIGMGLYKAACLGKINGETVDLRTPVTEDSAVEILTFDDDEAKKAYWHTTSHIMAQAVKRLYPETKLTIGPSIDSGFYYDFDCGDKPFTAEDIEKIEAEMKKIIKENLTLERFELSPEEAIALMNEKGETYKIELIKEHADKGENISFYKQGEFTELCAGPHIMETGLIKAFKLTNTTGAYWRGDSKNKMLCRVYGIAFPKKDQLEEYLEKLEEAKRRDHRKLGKELELFMTDELVGKGMPMFLPKGYTLWRILENYIRDKEIKSGYQHVLTPCVGTVDLYKTSGHWDHYKDNMFPAMEVDEETYVLRPMNCPHHMRIYANSSHSYRNLPVRIGEIAHDFRYEASGTLKGIERGRHFCQNDAHLFVTPEQIKDEFKKVVDLIFETYKDFGITDYRMVLSLRDPEDKEKYHDDDEMWNTAEQSLREVLDEIGLDYTEEIGEAAFYGPKLDVNVKPAVGAEYTLSTCQLDFCLPAKFNLTYVDKDNSQRTPVVLHRAILGSLDRFMAYLIEETMGNFPLWLSPVQVKLLPIADRHHDYARDVLSALEAKGIRAELDDRSEKIGYKIREAQLQKINYMLVIGDKEVDEKSVSVRRRGEGDIGSMSVDALLEKLTEEIETKALN
ncbi:MAG: threonine--tRNA ligase [Ruminococcaceae bacterium]|nr:threonine--tRNA ligase [Oscillospiraceae bacterium]